MYKNYLPIVFATIEAFRNRLNGPMGIFLTRENQLLVTF